MAELALIFDTSTGGYLAQQLATAHLQDAAVVSGKIGSGEIGPNHLADASVLSGILASGQVGAAHIIGNAVTNPKLAAEAVLSAELGSGQIGTDHLLNAAILSAKIGAAEVGTTHLANAAVLSGKVASGQIGTNHLADASILSSIIGSGQVGTDHLAEDLSVDILRDETLTAGEPISAYLAVSITSNGRFGVAKANVPGTMPAVAIAPAAVADGSQGAIQALGRMVNGEWSGSLGSPGDRLYVGSGGIVAATAPSASGDVVQRIAQTIDVESIFLEPSLAFAVQIAQ